MFCLRGMKPAEKPRGWLGRSGISNHTGSLASKMLIPPASAKTCAVQGKHLSLLQLTYLTQISASICTRPYQGIAGQTGLVAPGELPLLPESHQ